MATTKELALWANRVERECLTLSGADVESGLAAANSIRSVLPLLTSEEVDSLLSQHQFPDETEIDKPGDEPEEDWREEAEPIGTNDGKPVDLGKFFAYDIHNKKAQGVLNRTLRESSKLTAAAKADLSSLLKKGAAGVGEAILKFVEKYRLQLARLLTATQLASLLEGAREIATKIPALAEFPGAIPPPPTLEPEKAVELVERLSKLTVDERAEEVYKLPSEQQVYVQQAIAVQDAGGVPPSFTPSAPPANSPEEIHFPTIDEAVRLLREKNVMSKEKFEALSAAARTKAFTVANVEAEETLTKIRDSLAENIKEGVDYEEWRSKVMEDVGEGTFMSDAHQETVYRTNIQTQFSDGQMEVLQQPLVRGGFPYARQDAIHDDRVEDTHLEVEKIGIQGTNIFRINDPVFETFRAPWRWNCRCGWTPMTVRQAAEKGIVEAQQWLDSGVEPTPPEFVTMPDFRPPPEFQRAIGNASLSIQLSMRSLATFAVEEDKKPELVTDEEDVAIEWGAITEGALDTANESRVGKRVTKIEKRLKPKADKKKKKERSLFRKLRIKKTWNSSKALAVDPVGHHHKGKGRQGGGQFTSPGIEEGNVGSEQSTARQQKPSRVDKGGGESRRESEPSSEPRTDTGAENTGVGQESTTTPSFEETINLLKEAGVAQTGRLRTQEDFDKHNQEVLVAAKELGLLVDSSVFDKVTTPFYGNSGKNYGEYSSEHDVYEDAENNRFYKFTKPGPGFGISGDIHRYMWRLDTLNKMFPVLGYVFHGVVEGTEEGEEVIVPQIVTSMNKFSGSHPKQSEVEEWLSKKFVPHGPAIKVGNEVWQMTWKDPDSGLILNDTHKGNFIKYGDGLVPIDLDILPPEIETKEVGDANQEATTAKQLSIDTAGNNMSPDAAEGDDPAVQAPTVVMLDTPSLISSGTEKWLTSPYPSGREANYINLPEKVNVVHDWDKLRAVIVGRLDNDVLPAYYPSFEKPDANEVAGSETAGQTKKQFNPEMFDKAIEQTEVLCTLLKKEGIQVLRPPLLSPKVAQEPPVGLTAEWPRETITVISNRVIINQPRAAHRNKEPRALEPFLAELELTGKVNLLRLPACDWQRRDDNLEHDERPFLEGGDVFRLGKDVIVTMSYLATSPTGFRWLADQLAKDEVEVWPAYLTQEFEHGDYVFFPVRKGLCIAYLDGFVDGLLPSPVTDWDVISLTRQEANKQFAANGLVLGENRILLPKGSPRVVRALEKKGVEVIQVAFDGPIYWQGGIDCATTELWRGD